MPFPPAVLKLLADFYDGAERLFSLGGAMSSSWQTTSRGLAQGCPLSPLLAAALSHIWAVCAAGGHHARGHGCLGLHR